MDTVKRGPHRLERFVAAMTDTSLKSIRRPVGVRRFIPDPQGVSMRTLIGRKVATFALPQTIFTRDEHTACTHALLEYQKPAPGGERGLYTLNVDIQTKLVHPVLFCVGFATNIEKRWTCAVGGLNVLATGLKGPGVSLSNRGVFTYTDTSEWLGRHYDSAVSQGATFRIHASLHFDAILKTIESLSNFVFEWKKMFGSDLGLGGLLGKAIHSRDISGIDPNQTLAAQIIIETSEQTGGSGDDEGLSRDLKLIFL